MKQKLSIIHTCPFCNMVESNSNIRMFINHMDDKHSDINNKIQHDAIVKFIDDLYWENKVLIQDKTRYFTIIRKERKAIQDEREERLRKKLRDKFYVHKSRVINILEKYKLDTTAIKGVNAAYNYKSLKEELLLLTAKNKKLGIELQENMQHIGLRGNLIYYRNNQNHKIIYTPMGNKR